MSSKIAPYSYWHMVWKRFYKSPSGRLAFYVVLLFCLAGIYAPFLASSKPLFVVYDDELFFPLFRYLFYRGFYTKRLDIFFNLLIFTLPGCLLALRLMRNKYMPIVGAFVLQLILFAYYGYSTPQDPAANPALTQQRQQLRQQGKALDWNQELKTMAPYAKLNLVLREYLRKKQQESLLEYAEPYFAFMKEATSLPTLWQVEHDNEQEQIAHAEGESLRYLQERRAWINAQLPKLHWVVMPLLSSFHWEDDAGGQQALNRYLPWWELTRTNRKDLVSALIFGVRISLTVGFTAVGLALLIGVPIGAFSGYYGGKMDIVVCRLMEVWEAMPVLFMLLMVIALLQSKSIFLVTAVIGLFSWTTFSRYVRGECLKQRNLAYVQASHSLGLSDTHTLFKHILPNAIPPLLTLLPFAIMGAITSEAGLSFLGLGEENSCSWGVLMDEGRNAFPGESYLLWPPAILLTILLVAIALVGDSLRDTLDPKLHR